jgi:hypothetical protein
LLKSLDERWRMTDSRRSRNAGRFLKIGGPTVWLASCRNLRENTQTPFLDYIGAPAVFSNGFCFQFRGWWRDAFLITPWIT